MMEYAIGEAYRVCQQSRKQFQERLACPTGNFPSYQVRGKLMPRSRGLTSILNLPQERIHPNFIFFKRSSIIKTTGKPRRQNLYLGGRRSLTSASNSSRTRRRDEWIKLRGLSIKHRLSPLQILTSRKIVSIFLGDLRKIKSIFENFNPIFDFPMLFSLRQ